MKPVLSISDLTVSYGHGVQGKRTALDGVDLEIQSGEIFGLLGPNGAGKTTLIKSILGLIEIEKGSISIFGGSARARKTRSRLGYMPEVANYYWFMTPRETLEMFGMLSGMSRASLNNTIESTLELVGLSHEKDRLIRTFSKGMQDRLSIAQALLHDPEFLILDEPFSGLDPLGRIHTRNILKKIKGRGKTVLLSSHELSEAELICDTVCVMKSAKVLRYGPLKTLLEEKADHSLETYFIRMIGDDA